jgi:AcrR family transcriptional regulator
MATREPAGTRKNDPVAMRDRILDAAMQLFATRGYANTSTQDVLAAAGVTSGALHHHFPTKKRLGLAVISERVDREVEALWILPTENAASIKVAIGIMDAVAAGLRRRGEVRGCPLSNLAVELSYVEPDFRAPAQAIFNKWVLALTARIRADQRGGWRPELDAGACATLIVAAYSGAMSMSKAEQAPRALTATARMLDVLLA